MKSVYVAFGIAVVLAATNQAKAQSPSFTAEQRAEGEALVRKAAASIASTARDPSSVSFRKVFIQKRMAKDGRQPITLCGEVNGKNGYGGFTGFEKFILVGDNVSTGKVVSFPVEYLCANNNPIVDTRDYSPEMTAAFKAAAGG